MEINLKENARLRKEIALYQNELEAMELRARTAEAACKALKKKFKKLSEVMAEVIAEPAEIAVVA